jgi:hypothetical protein
VESYYRACVASHSSSPNGPFARLAALGTKKLAIIGAVVVVVIVGAVLAVALPSSKKTPPKSGTTTTSAPTSSSTSTSTSGAPHLTSKVCPLTDTPAPGGVVPKRPALAIKIGNEPEGARPQSGLNEADIVYDTPAEGGVMRYEAIYQCHEASFVEPIRSVRWVDWHILAMYRNLPLLVHAGGIAPDLAALDAERFVKDVNLIGNSPEASANVNADLGQRSSARQAPDNLYVNTASVWAAYKNEKQAPEPVFSYTKSLPSSAVAASSVQINYSYDTDPIWTWSAADDLWLHSYAGAGADIDALTNKQVSTNNIVVQIVKYVLGPYAESTGGSGDVESIMTGVGSGYIFRNGKEIPVTWHRPTLSSETTFTDAAGQKVGLTPGRTFVEIVLDVTAAEKGGIAITK